MQQTHGTSDAAEYFCRRRRELYRLRRQTGTPKEEELRRAQRCERDRHNRDDAGESLHSHQRELYRL